jgi:hypothetical protein
MDVAHANSHQDPDRDATPEQHNVLYADSVSNEFLIRCHTSYPASERALKQINTFPQEKTFKDVGFCF